MKNEMRLQGIGMVEGTEAGNLQVGDITRWNFGGLERITSIEFSKTGKTMICGIEYQDSKGEIVKSERKMRVTRLVNIVASASTNNDFNLQFSDDVEAMQEKIQERLESNEKHLEEKKEAEEVADFKRYSELLEKVYGMKTKATEEEQQELERLGYKLKLNGVPDAISDINLYRLQKLVEEAPEAEEAFFEMKPSIHEVYYQVTNNGTYVEIMLFVEDVANDIVLVSQQEGVFDSMAEAENLIELLKKSKNKIKYVETVAYTG